MKKFFEEHKKIVIVCIGILLFAGVFLFGGHPKIGRYVFEKVNEEKGGVQEFSLPNHAIVTKVIDGDTVIVQGGYSVRLLGIDSDEKNYPCFEPARVELENLVLGKDVRLEKDQEDKDIYGRFLRYVFLSDQNVNLEMVKSGMAVARFYPENQKYKAEITAAEQFAIDNKSGCKWGGR